MRYLYHFLFTSSIAVGVFSAFSPIALVAGRRDRGLEGLTPRNEGGFEKMGVQEPQPKPDVHSGSDVHGESTLGDVEQPAKDLQDAYDVLRRLRCDYRGLGRAQEVIEEWTNRSVKLYRAGLQAEVEKKQDLAVGYAAAAHELAAAVDHARNASRFEQYDPDLPRPPKAPAPGIDVETVRVDLIKAHDRVVSERLLAKGDEDAWYFAEAARSLYNAARRDVQVNRLDRGEELARASYHMAVACGHITKMHQTPNKPIAAESKSKPTKAPARSDAKTPGAQSAPIPPEIP